jgi:hypothetical protein
MVDDYDALLDRLHEAHRVIKEAKAVTDLTAKARMRFVLAQIRQELCEEG